MNTPKSPRRPTKDELLAARNKTLPDLVSHGLKILFCGINPGLYTAAIGHHFGRPGNRFWPALFASGFTKRLLDPADENELLPLGYGITNVVARATASADELTDEEFIEGGKKLLKKIRKYKPLYAAFLGVGAYRTAFGRPAAVLGPQPEKIGETRLWLLPSTSGLNAHYLPKDLARLFAELRQAVQKESEALSKKNAGD